MIDSKFVQIAADDGELYALDEQGGVWQWIVNAQLWQWLPDTREEPRPNSIDNTHYVSDPRD